MELTLHTETTIDSCHKLEGYDGVCSRLHGHSWFVEMWFKGDSTLVDKVGILVDFGIVKELKNMLDHQYLNNVVWINPTAENLTQWIIEWLRKRLYINQKLKDSIKIKVRLYETVVGKSTWCEAGDF
jgi:6-pyruvoyltetrahydropterin/6-carboxytetrahydropterin synthase